MTNPTIYKQASAGGQARAAKLDKARRLEIARKAATARWERIPKPRGEGKAADAPTPTTRVRGARQRAGAAASRQTINPGPAGWPFVCRHGSVYCQIEECRRARAALAEKAPGLMAILKSRRVP